ncbi:hypothetical protein AYI69_g3610 [Smittium culicis]|uniref:Uncharacterized protein n=1 Tax=Smittium culicis TaxID=133412 RepID=A0A1R1YJI6_9FUNG|nr:hypothetical protein AYI69_g3610 [Smittium culicis]
MSYRKMLQPFFQPNRSHLPPSLCAELAAIDPSYLLFARHRSPFARMKGPTYAQLAPLTTRCNCQQQSILAFFWSFLLNTRPTQSLPYTDIPRH